MKYLILIYEAESLWQSRSTEEQRQIVEDHWAAERKMQEDGVYIAAQRLMPTETATSVRFGTTPADVAVTDGPFAETKEQLGGFYMVDCKDLDQALGYAKMLRSATNSTVEVRPIMDACDADIDD